MKKRAVLFPGQGVQYLGMGKYLFDKYSMVKQIFEEASEYAGFDVAAFCFTGSSETLKLTEYTQPTVLINGYAAAQVLMGEYGFYPDYMAGHSLGEITAVTCSKGISLQDAVTFVKQRGKAMQDAVKNGDGAMSAIIGSDADTIAEVCEENSTGEFIVQISNKNSPAQTVISGHKQAVENVSQKLGKLGAKTVSLNVSAPFHCSLMEPAAAQLKSTLNSMSFHPLEIPVVSSVTGVPYLKTEDIANMWRCQLTRPVEWTNCMKFLQREGITEFVDAGPGETMKRFLNANVYGTWTVSLDKDEDAFEQIASRKGGDLK